MSATRGLRMGPIFLGWVCTAAIMPPTYAAGPYFVDPATEFGACTNSAQQLLPAISGNTVVWLDGRNGRSYDVYAKNLSTGAEFSVCTNPAGWRTELSINDNIVVWADHRSGNYDVYAKNLSTGTEFTVCTNSAAQHDTAISGNLVVWRDCRISNQVYGKNLTGGSEFIISASSWGYCPDVSGNIVVWDNGGTGSDPSQGIYAKNVGTGAQFPVCARTGIQTSPAVDGQIVVWEDYRRGSFSSEYGDIYAKDLSTGTEIAIQTRGFGSKPAVSGDIVVWADDRGIYGSDIRWGNEFRICDSTDGPGYPAISGNTVVWHTARYQEDIRGNYISYTDPSVGAEPSGNRLNTAAPGGASAPPVTFTVSQTAQSFVDSLSINYGDGSSGSVPFSQASSLTFTATASHVFELASGRDSRIYAVMTTAYGPTDASSDPDCGSGTVNVTLLRSPLATLSLDGVVPSSGGVLEVVPAQILSFDGSPAVGFIENALLSLGGEELLSRTSVGGNADQLFQGTFAVPNLPVGEEILLEYLTSNTGAGLNANTWSATLQVVPEPGSCALLGVASLVGLLVRRRRSS